MKRLNTTGDTIVEVLIAILVVATILGGAFVSARRSQVAVRSSQERVEGLKVAESQMERVKYIAKNDANADSLLFGASDELFCIDEATSTKQPLAGPKPALTDDAFDNPVRCQSIPSGVTFHSFVERIAATNTFVVYTRWDGVGGSGKQEVQLAARIDP